MADGQPGSRLSWIDVVDAAWRCYQPLKDLCVNDTLGNGASCYLHECRHQSFRYDAGTFALIKRLMILQWRPDTDRPVSLLGTPTAKRYLAALLAHEPDESSICVLDLPEPDDFDYVTQSGGFAILHDRGVLLFDDWRPERLRTEKLTEEIRRVFDLLSLVCQTRADLDALAQELATKEQRSAPALLADMSALRARLTGAEQRLQPASHWEDVRRFRKALERRWGLEGVLPDLHKRVVQIEDMVRTDSTLKTQRLVSIIASYGLAFFISGAVTTFLAPANEAGHWPPFSLAITKVILYAGIALSLVAAIKLINRWLFWRHGRQRRVFGPR